MIFAGIERRERAARVARALEDVGLSDRAAPPPRAALRRRAPARGDRAGRRHGADGAAGRRADRQPRHGRGRGDRRAPRGPERARPDPRRRDARPRDRRARAAPPAAGGRARSPARTARTSARRSRPRRRAARDRARPRSPSRRGPCAAIACARGSRSLGVAVGVASVVLLTSLGEGARRYVTGEFANLGTNLLIVLPGKTETTGVHAVRDRRPPRPHARRRRGDRPRGVRRSATLAPSCRHRHRGVRGERRRDVTVVGTTADFSGAQPRLAIGRFLPPGEADREPRVCVHRPEGARGSSSAPRTRSASRCASATSASASSACSRRGACRSGMDIDEMVHRAGRPGDEDVQPVARCSAS